MMIIIIIIYLYLHKTHQLMNLRLYLTASDGFRGSIAPCLWDAGLVLRGGKRGAGEGFMGIEWGLYILSHIYMLDPYRHIYIYKHIRTYVHTYMHSNYITQIQFFLKNRLYNPNSWHFDTETGNLWSIIGCWGAQLILISSRCLCM